MARVDEDHTENIVTTSNGQPPTDQEGTSEDASSTVLALDGWGPVLPQPSSNGANGHEPAPAATASPEHAPLSQPRGSQISLQLAPLLTEISHAFQQVVHSPTIRILTPATAMTFAVLFTVKLAESIERGGSPNFSSAPADSLAKWRRRLALWIDPSLEAPEPAARHWTARIVQWLRSL